MSHIFVHTIYHIFWQGQGIVVMQDVYSLNQAGSTICAIMIQVKQQLHIGVYGVLQRGNKVLVVHKSRGPYKGKFDLPGGRPQHGESITQTLQREFMEETGFSPNNFHFLINQTFLVPYINAQNEACELYHIALIYRVTDHDIPSALTQICEEDVAGSSWVSKELLSEENSSPLLLGALYESL